MLMGYAHLGASTVHWCKILLSKVSVEGRYSKVSYVFLY